MKYLLSGSKSDYVLVEKEDLNREEKEEIVYELTKGSSNSYDVNLARYIVFWKRFDKGYNIFARDKNTGEFIGVYSVTPLSKDYKMITEDGIREIKMNEGYMSQGIYVRRDHRGQGIGKEMRELLLKELLANGIFNDKLYMGDYYLRPDSEVMKKLLPEKYGFTIEELERKYKTDLSIDEYARKIDWKEIKKIREDFNRNPIKSAKKYLITGSSKAFMLAYMELEKLGVEMFFLGISPTQAPTLVFGAKLKSHRSRPEEYKELEKHLTPLLPQR